MPVSVICSCDISDKIQKSLLKLDFIPLKIPPCADVDVPINSHPDIQLFAADEFLFCHKNICRKFLKKAEKYYDVIICDEVLSKNYPEDIYFNAALIGNYFFHKLPHTSKKIAAHIKKKNTIEINVNQAYSRCSILEAGENSIITADLKIHEKAVNAGMHSLRVNPGFINLPGYKYGFIGGCGGFYRNKVYLSGKLDHHPDAPLINDFLIENKVDLIHLSDDNVTDYGSFIFKEF